MKQSWQAVVFDLDGTLIDSLPDLTSAVNHMLDQHGRAALTGAEVARMVGDGALSLVQRAFAARGGQPSDDLTPVLAEFLQHYEANATVQTRPFPGVADALQRLRDAGMRLAVCTNKPSVATGAILADLGLDGFFDAVVGSDDVPAIKPDPAHLLHVLDRLQVSPSQAVMVGDSINDILTAQRSQVYSIAVTFGYAHGPVQDLGADLLVDSYDDLAQALLA